MRTVKAALVAASVVGMVAASAPANAAYYEAKIPGTPCVLYTNIAVVANPQSRPPVNTTGTDVGVRCRP